MLGDGGTSVAERVNLALEAWKVPTDDTIFVFENAEHIARDPSAREFFARLLTQRGEGRAVVICSRENLRVHLTRFASPHEILTLRAEDLAFDRTELARLFHAYEGEPGFLTRIMQLSQGWPIAVFLLKRFANEGRIEKLLESLDDVAFEELPRLPRRSGPGFARSGSGERAFRVCLHSQRDDRGSPGRRLERSRHKRLGGVRA